MAWDIYIYIYIYDINVCIQRYKHVCLYIYIYIYVSPAMTLHAFSKRWIACAHACLAKVAY